MRRFLKLEMKREKIFEVRNEEKRRFLKLETKRKRRVNEVRNKEKVKSK